MPGITNNTTLLSADNQLILTQNEQTVKLEEIEQAILSLKRAISSGGTGTGSGENIGPSGDQDLSGVSPDDLTTEQGNKRCRVANFVFDGIKGIFYGLKNSPVEEGLSMAAAVVIGLPAAIITYSILSATVLAFSLALVIGVAMGAFLVSQTSCGAINDELENKKQEIINGLYNSKNVVQAKAAFMDNVTLSTFENYLLSLICDPSILRALFMSDFEVPADYVSTMGCRGYMLGDWTAVINFFEGNEPGSYIGPISEGNYYQQFESMPFSVWGRISDGPPNPPDNGYEYFTAINLDVNAASDTRTFQISGVTGLSEPIEFYSSNNFVGQLSSQSVVPKVYTVTGCNSFRFRTVRNSGERAIVTIRGSEWT